MSFRTMTEVVEACENTLGWLPPASNKPRWRLVAAEVGKLVAAQRKQPDLVTFKNLEIALDYSRRKKMPVKSPVGLVYRIEEALEFVDTREITPIQQQIDSALEWEAKHDLPDSSTWRSRLIRSSGTARDTTLADWREARGLT
jgi:hypothetical protein